MVEHLTTRDFLRNFLAKLFLPFSTMSFAIKVEGCLNYLMEEQSKGTKMQKTEIRAAEKVFIPGRKHRPEETSKKT